MDLRWLFLDLNSYFASVEQAENPELRGKPVAVVPMLVETTCCLAASYEAKAKGVRTGTLVSDARRRCPNITFIKASHTKYVDYHHRILEVVDKVIPITKVMSIDEMACNLIGREREERVAIEKARAVKSALREEISPALTCSIGLAPNKFLAKVGSDLQKPDGLVILHQRELPDRLYPLSVRDLPGIGEKMEQRLASERCYTVRDLCKLSPQRMRAIWGSVSGENLWHLLRGEEIQEKETNRGSVGHSKVLSPDKRTKDRAWPITTRLLSKATMRLRSAGYYSKHLSLNIKFISFREDERYWEAGSSFHESNDTGRLIGHLGDLWKNVPDRPILRVGVTLTKLVPRSHHQFSLFEDPRSEKRMEAIDGINRKFQKPILLHACSLSEQDSAPPRIAFGYIPDKKD